MCKKKEKDTTQTKKKHTKMISVKSTLRSRFYPLIQRSLQHNHGVRPMTVISKSSAEEYNQKVIVLRICLIFICFVSFVQLVRKNNWLA